MSKDFDWKAILGIAAVAGIGYVVYKFAKGDWKLPDLGGLIKFPDIRMPSITLPDILFPDQPKGATLPEAVLATLVGSVADPTFVRMRELTGLPYAAPPEAWKKTPEEMGLVAPLPPSEVYAGAALPSPSMIKAGIEYLTAQGVTQERAEWIYAGGIRGVGREQVEPLIPYAVTYPYVKYVSAKPGIVTAEAELPAAVARERGLPQRVTVI